MEVETNGRLPFLDMELIHETDGSISTKWYKKPCASGRIINFLSLHEPSQKINTALNFINRVNMLSSNTPQKDLDDLVIELLHKNNFPKALTKKLIQKWKEKKTSNTNPLPNQQQVDEADKKRTALTFIPGLTKSLTRTTREHTNNIIFAYRTHKSTSHLYSTRKDKVDKMKRVDVIYSYPCKQCKPTRKYIGKTTRRLETRNDEHSRASENLNLVMTKKPSLERDAEIFKMHKTATAMVQHEIETGHNFNHAKVEILDATPNNNKLSTLEMLHIRTNNTVNRRTDVLGLGHVYTGIIEELQRQEFI
jgi:hypothetical protein